MAHIDLLPWRETQRKNQQKEFLALLGFAAVTAVIAVGLVHIHVNGLIDHQILRNKYLENEITILDNKIKEIRKLEATRKALVERMSVIENLQATRPGIVHLFDELTITLPEGTYLTSLKQTGSKLAIKGKAESNARVSAYMRNINGSDWVQGSRLDIIETHEQDGLRVSDFSLQANQTSPEKKAKAEQER